MRLETRAGGRRSATVEPSAEGKPARLAGYAATFETRSEILIDCDGNPFREIITRGAFAESVASGDVRAFAHHDEKKILGRTGNGTLRIAEDETGLYCECDLPTTSYAADHAASVTRGDLDGNSFGFVCAEGDDEFSIDPDGIALRRLNRVHLAEVTLGTVWPAYQGTSLSLRSRGALAAADAVGQLGDLVVDDVPPLSRISGPGAKSRRRLARAIRALRILDL